MGSTLLISGCQAIPRDREVENTAFLIADTIDLNDIEHQSFSSEFSSNLQQYPINVTPSKPVSKILAPSGFAPLIPKSLAKSPNEAVEIFFNEVTRLLKIHWPNWDFKPANQTSTSDQIGVFISASSLPKITMHKNKPVWTWNIVKDIYTPNLLPNIIIKKHNEKDIILSGPLLKEIIVNKGSPWLYYFQRSTKQTPSHFVHHDGLYYFMK